MKTGAEGEELCTDVMGINWPGDLADSASLGLTLALQLRIPIRHIFQADNLLGVPFAIGD